MASFQQMIIIGNAGRDIEMRYTPSGQAVANVSVAVNRNYRDEAGEWQSVATWFTGTLWGELAERHSDTENAYAFIGKGKSVMFIGEMQEPRIYEGKDNQPRCNLEMRVRMVRILDRQEREGGGAETRWEAPPDMAGSASSSAAASTPDPLDDVPF